MCRLLIRLVLLVLFLVAPVPCVPGSRSKAQVHLETRYDQKQSGDYNIQLHLKDFQILALLGDTNPQPDYEYNYDYADLTVKPVQVSPVTPNSSVSTPSTVSASLSSSTVDSSSSTKPSPTIISITTSKPPVDVKLSGHLKDPSGNSQQSTDLLIIKSKEHGDLLKVNKQPHQLSSDNISFEDDDSSSFFSDESSNDDEDDESAITRISFLLPSESKSAPEIPPPRNRLIRRKYQRVPTRDSSYVHRLVKKCARGQVRDKRGRCKKIKRRSDSPLNIRRIASRLVSRLNSHTANNLPH